MNVYNYLLVSRKTGDAFKIKSEVERNKLYKVQMIETAQAALERIEQGGIHCVIFNLDSFRTTNMGILTNLRELGYAFPIILFASYVQKEAYDSVQHLRRVVIIEKPFEAKDVWGICQKILQGRRVNQRIFRRFYTNQVAQLQKTISGEIVNAQIFNLSRGGAYIELRDGRVQPGDLVRVSIYLDKVSRSYNVDAQVVWATPKGFWNGKPAAGVQFVQAGDVYRNLLEKL